MKRFAFTIAVLMLVLYSCKKTGQEQSVISLLQNKWKVQNETTVMPNACGVFQRLIYTGVPTDFYLFDKNDSLKVGRAGTLFYPSNPNFFSTLYSLSGNNEIILINPSTNRHDTTSIVKITTDSLILKSSIYYTIANLCSPNSTEMTGVANDTLRLYR